MTEKWMYPWAPNEDPDYVDAELGKLGDRPDYYRWFQSMREKYGYPRKEHVPIWEPRYRTWMEGHDGR
jgi:hypothetical protein